MRCFISAVFLCGAQALGFNPNPAFFGTWSPVNHSTPHAIIGPSGVLQTFTMTPNPKNGDTWMSGIPGQVFRITQTGAMQYCFARVASSPFEVDFSTMTDNRIVFCYKQGERMNSHKANATGCDAANIELNLHPDGVLEFTFRMSPPLKHAWVLLKRRANPPPLSYYKVTDIFGACNPDDPPPPTLASSSSDAHLASMCPTMTKRNLLGSSMAQNMSTPNVGGETMCHQIGTFLGGLITKESVNIRLQYTIPAIRCWPCKIKYAVSAKIEDNQYISVGFKGMGYRFYEGMIPSYKPSGVDRPNYFGMKTDEIDETRTGSVIATAYTAHTQGGCVREMKAENYIGTPHDVAGNPHLFNPSVERKNGRTIMRFEVEQHAGREPLEVQKFFRMEQQSQRMMWAIGNVQAPSPSPSPSPSPAGKFECSICQHIYDPDADGQGMAFEDLPDSFVCPVCGQPKNVFQPVGVDELVEQYQGACKEKIAMHDHGQRGVSPLTWIFQHERCVFDAEEFGQSPDDGDSNVSSVTIV